MSDMCSLVLQRAQMVSSLSSCPCITDLSFRVLCPVQGEVTEALEFNDAHEQIQSSYSEWNKVSNLQTPGSRDPGSICLSPGITAFPAHRQMCPGREIPLCAFGWLSTPRAGVGLVPVGVGRRMGEEPSPPHTTEHSQCTQPEVGAASSLCPHHCKHQQVRSWIRLGQGNW